MFKFITFIAFLITPVAFAGTTIQKSDIVQAFYQTNVVKLGSKFPFSPSYSLTNIHVIGDIQNYQQKFILNSHCDAALIPEKNKEEDLPTFQKSKLGEDVLMYGHPGARSEELEVKAKIIGYSILKDFNYTKNCKLAVVNAKVYQGMSGGPVYNKQGEVIGMILGTSKTKTESYFIPMEEIADFLLANNR